MNNPLIKNMDPEEKIRLYPCPSCNATGKKFGVCTHCNGEKNIAFAFEHESSFFSVHVSRQ